MVKTYNINELLEKKKELEKSIAELSSINSEELIYEKNTIVDLTNEKNCKEIEKRPKVSIDTFTQKFLGIVEELRKIKTAILKFNSEEVSDLLYKREETRLKIEYLTLIKNRLSRDKKEERIITRRTQEGVALEQTDILEEPMFNFNEVEKRINQECAEERKLNTNIQKLNLDAKIQL